MFSDIIELLSELEPKDNAGDHLLGLTSVPRVSALTMFMSQEERSRVSKILSDNKDLKSDHVKKIRSTFEL